MTAFEARDRGVAAEYAVSPLGVNLYGADPPRLLIEDWLPARAIGVECMRERGSASALAPHTYLHVWWARRPLTVSRAAVLASLLPADFPRDRFERLLGFSMSGSDIVAGQQMLDYARASATKIQNPHGQRAFKAPIREDDLDLALENATSLWGSDIAIIDPMAGGGSIPLEAARLGFRSLANEYNPVACTVLEATVDFPFRHGAKLGLKTREWAAVWRERFNSRMAHLFPKVGQLAPLCYVYARTVPCPDTQHPTPLVPDWHLLNPKSGRRIAAVPVVDKAKGTWRVQIREVGRGAGQITAAPPPTYKGGKGVSLFSPRTQIPGDWIKAQAQAGRMGSAFYAVAVKTPQGLEFFPPGSSDLAAIVVAEKELAKLRPQWKRDNVLPTEEYPETSSDERPRIYGMPHWADFFTPRQLLGMGVLVEELKGLKAEILAKEGAEVGSAIVEMLALVFDKFMNHNCNATRFENTRAVIKGKMDRHDYSFKVTFAEMAPCGSGSGLDWAIDNVCDAYESLCTIPRAPSAAPAEITLGSATSLPWLADGSITAVVVDPPYADNVQYSELADFFYVWLKRTIGDRHPEWFATYLCDYDEEAVVNVSRFREGSRERGTAQAAREKANDHYAQLMTASFREARRILRDDGVLTVMFTHKKQEAWEALFASLIDAGFTITATWPVKTESEHSLHQAKKNAAQSTVILVARKRRPKAGVGYFDAVMKEEIRERARASAARLAAEGLNAVDQLVGSFGPAMEVYSRYDEVRTDTGEKIRVGYAIDEASDAVSEWRIEQLAARGLDGVEPEGRFALLCWDVLGAAEFRFNEAKLLGHAVGMDVDALVAAGLVRKSGDKMTMLSAKERRRDRPLKPEEAEETLFGPVVRERKRSRADALRIHPNDPKFRTALDVCQALALRYIEAKDAAAGIGSARQLAHQLRLTRDVPAARLMDALVHAAPQAVRVTHRGTDAAAQFPEFRAWHALLKPLFGVEPSDWTPKAAPQAALALDDESEAEDGDDAESEED